jgi:hypothetical protein
MEQAPLVYSSKISVGIDMTGTSTENPGVSLSLGYKQVDAAYIPVAVAKACDATKTAADCKDTIYALKVLQGNLSTQDGGERQSDVEAKRVLADYDAALLKLDGAKAATSNKQSEFGQLNGRKIVLEQKKGQSAAQEVALAAWRVKKAALDAVVAPAVLTDAEQKSLVDLNNKIQAGNPYALTAEETKEIAGIDARIAQALVDLGKLTAELPPLQAALDQLKQKAFEAKQLLNSLGRTDAYSVFGRFDATTSAEAAAGKVSLGKVFSTGVASQSLAQGLGDYYKATAVTSCYEAVAKLTTSDTKRLEMIDACIRQVAQR